MKFSLYSKKNRLAALARRFGAKRLVLFGSRARGDNRPNSDMDLAVYGMPPDNRAEFWMECEDLPTLLKFDIVHMQDGMNPAFVANIEKDGVELMDKLHEKYNYLKEAVKRLMTWKSPSHIGVMKVSLEKNASATTVLDMPCSLSFLLIR